MIISNIDITTKEGMKEFNDKYKGEFEVTHSEGWVHLKGVNDKVSLNYDTDTNTFEVENGKTK